MVAPSCHNIHHTAVESGVPDGYDQKLTTNAAMHNDNLRQILLWFWRMMT
jgi:hypothetical protein